MIETVLEEEKRGVTRDKEEGGTRRKERRGGRRDGEEGGTRRAGLCYIFPVKKMKI